MNKKTIYILLVVSFIVFLILALVFNNQSNDAIEKSKRNLSEFSNIYNNNKTYIYIDNISEIKNGYAIAFDRDNQSIIYLDEELSNSIKDYNFDSRNIKLVGESTGMIDEAENNILEIYNADSIEGTEDYLLKEDFSSVFGSYFLKVNRIENDNDLHKMPSFLSSLFLDLGLVSLLVLGFKIILDRR